jgi:hypothetical protein
MKATRHGARSASQCFVGASIDKKAIGSERESISDDLSSFLTQSLRSYASERLGLLMPGVNLHDLLVGLLHGLLSLPVLHQHPVHHAANQIGA